MIWDECTNCLSGRWACCLLMIAVVTVVHRVYYSFTGVNNYTRRVSLFCWRRRVAANGRDTFGQSRRVIVLVGVFGSSLQQSSRPTVVLGWAESSEHVPTQQLALSQQVLATPTPVHPLRPLPAAEIYRALIDRYADLVSREPFTFFINV